MIDLNPATTRLLKKVLPFGVFWGLGAFVYTILEKGIMGDSTQYPSTGNPYQFYPALLVTISAAIIAGWVMGIMEVRVLSKMFHGRPWGLKIFLKTFIYLVGIVAFLFISSWIGNVFQMGKSPFSPEILAGQAAFFWNFAFFSIIVYVGFIVGLIIFISDVSDNIGLDVLGNYLVGKYHRPREEERIFMFLDMKSSTPIAEKLGHVRYFELLKMYYSELTKVIIETSGEIYEYVGDEIIVTWKPKQGLSNLNCIRCFFLMKEQINQSSDHFQSEFGVVPQFKAGLHCGLVTTGEVGVIKKNIIFSGDILNTTSRIQDECNERGVDILISEELLARLNLNGIYQNQEIGEVELRGKGEKVTLYTLTTTQQD